MPVFILLFQCRDQKGIVARVSDFIWQRGGNIITADQYSTNPQGGHFFMRVEFLLDDGRYEKRLLADDFAPIAKQFNAGWSLFDRQAKPRLGILVSRPGHCLAELLYLWESGDLPAEIAFVASNYAGHQEAVERHKIPFHFIPAAKEGRREADLLALACGKTDFLVLARYMLILSEEFLRSYGRDIINIHHGFLPSFKGANPYRQAFQEGVKVIGATAHFATAELDAGPIIAQAVEPVSHRDDIPALLRRGKRLEKQALTQALQSYLDYRVIRHENRTIVF